MPALPLTRDQLDDAARLKHRFLNWQKRQKEAGLPSSQEAACDFLGFNQSALSQYLNGRIPLNIEAATKFSALIACPIADFSPSLASEVAKYAAVTIPPVSTALDENPFLQGARPVRIGEESDTIPIRRVKLKLRAGIAGYETEPELEDGGVLEMPRRVIEKNNFIPHLLLAVAIKGCSMEPMLFEDDVVVINTADKKPVDRELFAVNFNGEACVKQLWKDGGQWFLRSFHPKHGPVNVRSGQCDIVGRVVYQPGRELTGRL